MNHVQDGALTFNAVYKEYLQGGIGVSVLKNVSISFKEATSYAITGVSGSGKSTLLHLLAGLEKPTAGVVTAQGHDINAYRQKHRQAFLNKTIGLMFQFHYSIKELTVLENVMLAGMIKGESKASCTQRAYHLLDIVGLSLKATVSPALLSGGEQQRVSLARALFNKPSFLLADEPTGNLDGANAAAMIDLMFAAQKEWGMGIIVCTHDEAVWSRMSAVYHVAQGTLNLS